MREGETGASALHPANIEGPDAKQEQNGEDGYHQGDIPGIFLRSLGLYIDFFGKKLGNKGVVLGDIGKELGAVRSGGFYCLALYGYGSNLSVINTAEEFAIGNSLPILIRLLKQVKQHHRTGDDEDPYDYIA